MLAVPVGSMGTYLLSAGCSKGSGGIAGLSALSQHNQALFHPPPKNILEEYIFCLH